MNSPLLLADLDTPNSSDYQKELNRYVNEIFKKLPENTQKSYTKDLNHYYQFCYANNYPGLTPDLKLTEKTIKQYVMAMCTSQLSYNTITHRMATLSKFMSIAKLPDPLKLSEYLRDFIKLEMREHEIYNRANQAPALRLEMVNQINTNVCTQKILNSRDIAIVNVMFDGLLRAGDLSKIQLHHFEFEKNRILIPQSKSDQEGRGTYRFVSNTTIGLINNYIEKANTDRKTGKPKPKSDLSRINKGIVFRKVSPKGTTLFPYNEKITRSKDMEKLNYTSVYRALKRLAKMAGINESISAHSPRVGGAVTMAESNIGLDKIKEAGGWKSGLMPARYTEQAVKDSGMSELAKMFDR